MGKPAARITDMHTCPIPIHVGGPVITGNVTVLIGGMPAATVGDMCTCVGPPDVIVQGSKSVLIGGRPAARMGDSTAHGGKIMMGCMTVLIGDNGGGGGMANISLDDKANGDGRTRAAKLSSSSGGSGGAAQEAARHAAKGKRYEERLALIAKGRQRAKELRDRAARTGTGNWRQASDDLKQAAALEKAADRLERNNRAIERARLTNDIYTLWDKEGNPINPRPAGSPPDGWVMTDYKLDKETGFAYGVYESTYEKPSKPVLVFRGSYTPQDWEANERQAVGMEDRQYQQSMDKAKDMKQTYGSDGFEIAGHSKAGGQAAAASIVTGAKGYTYNAAGVHENTVGREKHSTAEARGKRADGTPLVEAYNFVYDPLSVTQDTGVPILKAKFGPILYGMGPSAAGQRYQLKAVDENGQPIDPDMNKIKDFHSLEMLIGSMEHEKRVDVQTLAG